jgi:iron(II)-dependent oxidoreductase
MHGTSDLFISRRARTRATPVLPALLAAAWFCAGAALPGEAAVPPGPGAAAGRSEDNRHMQMVLIPGGAFLMGSGTEGDHNPAHLVRLDPFFIDRYEVTNAQYEAFCRETKRGLPMFWGLDSLRSGPGYPDHPVVGVSWVDARAYAEWCGKRLPTEAEWECAARGGLLGREYPNADTLGRVDANYTKAHRGGTVPVGSYPPNRFGLCDMVGNVIEWVSDWYAADTYATSSAAKLGPDGRLMVLHEAANPKGPAEGKFRVIRGGGWHSGPGCCKVYVRNALPWGWLDFNVGFRCARDVGRTGSAPPDSLAPRTRP